jgi:PadR family transcriptional regulator, regulatory protein PadR
MPKKQDTGVIVLSALEEDILTLSLGQRIYGLDILERLNQARQKQGINGLGVGSLYPTLKRMETAGLIKGEWGEEVAVSTRRRYYRVTAEGEIAISRTQAYRRLLAERSNGQSAPEGQTANGFWSDWVAGG